MEHGDIEFIFTNIADRVLPKFSVASEEIKLETVEALKLLLGPLEPSINSIHHGKFKGVIYWENSNSFFDKFTSTLRGRQLTGKSSSVVRNFMKCKQVSLYLF
jgi:hypothetical protein